MAEREKKIHPNFRLTVTLHTEYTLAGKVYHCILYIPIQKPKREMKQSHKLA